MSIVQAIYENGVFRPLNPVHLPDQSYVEFEPRVAERDLTAPSLDVVYALLNQRFQSGQSDVAARHDEHQP